MRLDANLL
jgi:hypothetical protein